MAMLVIVHVVHPIIHEIVHGFVFQQMTLEAAALNFWVGYGSTFQTHSQVCWKCFLGLNRII